MKRTHAMLRWIPATAGGRRQPVTAWRYTFLAQFDGAVEDPEWTLAVYRVNGKAHAEENVVVHFLMGDAPHERIATGARLHLYEGRQVVAELDVLEDMI